MDNKMICVINDADWNAIATATHNEGAVGVREIERRYYRADDTTRMYRVDMDLDENYYLIEFAVSGNSDGGINEHM